MNTWKSKKAKFVGGACLALVLGLVILAGCGKPEPDPSGGDGSGAELQKVTIGMTRLRISVALFAAQGRGLFKKHGLDVEIKPYDTAQPLMQSLVAGHLDVAGYTALPITFTSQQRSKVDLLYLTMMLEDDAHPMAQLIKRKGLKLGSLKDLEGKKVGSLPTKAFQAWMTLILKENGVDPLKTQVIPLAPNMTAKALQSGTVDVVLTVDPVVTATIKAGVAELATQEALVPKYVMSPHPFGSFNIRKDFAEKNPALVRKVAMALDEAIDWVNNNPAEAKLEMAKFLPDQWKAHVPAYADALYVKCNDIDASMLSQAAQKAVDLGIIEKPLDLKTALYRYK